MTTSITTQSQETPHFGKVAMLIGIVILLASIFVLGQPTMDIFLSGPIADVPLPIIVGVYGVGVGGIILAIRLIRYGW